MKQKEKTFGDIYGINERIVQCNWCMTKFDEEEIIVIDDDYETERCPNCGKEGFLMDMNIEGVKT